MLERATFFDHSLKNLSQLAYSLLFGFAALPHLAAQTPAAPAQERARPIQPVTTTVVVQGDRADDYLPTELSAGSLDGLPLLSAPVSATVVTRDLMDDQGSRVLSDLVKNDASIGEDYAPVGYYGDFQIRGFTIDLATSLQVNDMPIAGEQDVPLENKERVEFLKGIAGVEGGITTAGGLINYVTKRPATVKTIDVATDHRGTSYAAVDLGRLFGKAHQVGVRTNMAGEDIKTYVESTNGWRGVGAASADWKLSASAMLKADFEYQHKRERDVAGYQLLGGTVVPDLNRVYPSVMLGDQPWSKPNIFDTFNANARLDLDAPAHWHVYMAGSYSHSLIDDNVIYPYGAALAADGVTPLCPQAPYYFFCPDGSYEAYDYRSPGEFRIDTLGEIIASGHVKTGPITHDIVLGGSMFYRSVDLSPGIIYAPIGVENIYQSDIVFQEQSYVAPSPSVLADYNHQASGIMQDRITLPGRVRITAGGRYAAVSDYNFNGSKGVWLPQYSATWSPVADLTLYGNYNVMLSLGPQAPFWVDNSSQYLAPFFTRQAEVGAKYAPGRRILLSAALFHMRAPFFYPKVIEAPDSFCTGSAATPVNPGDLCFEAEGRETHDGIEVGAQGKAASWLRLSATAAGIQATSSQSGTPAFDNKQVINVPRVKTTLFADIALPRLSGLRLSDLHLLPGWSYTDRKEATRDDTVSVGGYNLFNVGARYSPGGDEGHMIFRLYADNILDKRYWKDTGASYGDTFIHLGAPTTVRLSGQYRF
jgi:iron complex outermembrane recepter protein